jgi:hypothetical protein
MEPPVVLKTDIKTIEKIKEIRKNCEGCLTFITIGENVIFCGLPHKKDGHYCPCSQCLVKSTCEEECDLLDKYKGSE